MTEAKLQKKLIDKYEAQGWYVLKLIKTNKNGIPDLLCLKHRENPRFIEVKSQDRKGVLSPIQRYRIKELRANGFYADVTASLEEFDCDKEIRCANQCEKCIGMTMYP